MCKKKCIVCILLLNCILLSGGIKQSFNDVLPKNTPSVTDYQAEFNPSFTSKPFEVDDGKAFSTRIETSPDLEISQSTQQPQKTHAPDITQHPQQMQPSHKEEIPIVDENETFPDEV